MNADEQNNTSIIPIEISESYEQIIPVLTKEEGAKSTFKIPYHIDLVALVLETQTLYKTLKKTDSKHELLKMNFKFEDSNDLLTVTYYPRPEDELKYGKHLVSALLTYYKELYDTVNV